MRNLRRIIVVVVAAIAGIAPTAQPGIASAQEADASSRFTRLDTDAAGNPESAGEPRFVELSGNGRYALFAVHSTSNMVPPPHRTDRLLGHYPVRKDLRTGQIILVSRKENGSPLRADWRYSAIGWDGTTFAYSTGETGSDPAERGALFHHDLVTGRTTTLIQCADPFGTCRRAGRPLVSDDGTRLAFDYRARSGDPVRLTLLDTTTGELRTWEENSKTLFAGVVSADRTGSLIGHYWLSGDSGRFGESRALVHDQSTGKAISLRGLLLGGG
ncbi:hypothetical protein [Actinosynnema sp. NPDC023587]|uniref:hypothetical protein n=1 Tax=Actinosynnema sp. NPDC023587 TaxID=3154695 RepID=UPI0033DC3634